MHLTSNAHCDNLDPDLDLDIHNVHNNRAVHDDSLYDMDNSDDMDNNQRDMDSNDAMDDNQHDTDIPFIPLLRLDFLIKICVLY